MDTSNLTSPLHFVIPDVSEAVGLPTSAAYASGTHGAAYSFLSWWKKMLRPMRWLITILLLCAPLPAHCLIVNDPIQTAQAAIAFATQIATLKTQMSELLTHTELLQGQLQNQQSMITRQDNMTKSLSPTQWENFSQQFMELGHAAQQGDGISYAMGDITHQFQERYPGYQAPDNYPAAYENWSQNTLSSINGSLNAAGLQHNEFATENAKLDSLQRLSQSATGQTQAIQASNLLAASLITQLQKLRQLQMSQIQSQDAYMAYVVNKESAEAATLDKIFHRIKPKGNNPGY